MKLQEPNKKQLPPLKEKENLKRLKLREKESELKRKLKLKYGDLKKVNHSKKLKPLLLEKNYQKLPPKVIKDLKINTLLKNKDTKKMIMK
jgi:hypothetical protein